MFRLVLIFLASQANTLILGLFVQGTLTLFQLMALQFAFLINLIGDWVRYGKGYQVMSFKRRGCWVFGSLLFMGLISLLVTQLEFETTSNQVRLMTVQEQVPILAFAFFLVNASLCEEYVYRQLLWEKCQVPFSQLALTTTLFTLAHSPSTLQAFLLYAGLGGCLGLVRLKTDSVTSSLVHLTWNGFVFALSFL